MALREPGLRRRQLIESLLADEKSPDRAAAFHELVSLSRECEGTTDLVDELYRFAADGAWATSLQDQQMLPAWAVVR